MLSHTILPYSIDLPIEKADVFDCAFSALRHVDKGWVDVAFYPISNDRNFFNDIESVSQKLGYHGLAVSAVEQGTLARIDSFHTHGFISCTHRRAVGTVVKLNGVMFYGPPNYVTIIAAGVQHCAPFSHFVGNISTNLDSKDGDVKIAFLPIQKGTKIKRKYGL